MESHHEGVRGDGLPPQNVQWKSSVKVTDSIFLSLMPPHITERVPLRQEFDFLPAIEDDFDEILHLCLTEFRENEPHSQLLGLQMEETLQIFEYLVGKSLHYPYSIKVVNRLTGEIVAFRTMSIGHRDSSLDWEPFPLDVDSFSKNMNLLGDVLNDCKENFWNSVDPSVTKVLRREISSVVKRHQRKGIAKAMLELGLDFTDLKAKGIQGITSEATSLANQTLLETNGYKCVYVPEYEWSKMLMDGQKSMKVLFKDIRMAT